MRTQSPARTLLGVVGIAAVLTASACGSTDETGTAEPSRDITSTRSAPTETTAPHPDRCLIGELQVTLGQASGAAGSQEIPLVFTNTGTRDCVLHGYPGCPTSRPRTVRRWVPRPIGTGEPRLR